MADHRTDVLYFRVALLDYGGLLPQLLGDVDVELLALCQPKTTFRAVSRFKKSGLEISEVGE